MKLPLRPVSLTLGYWLAVALTRDVCRMAAGARIVFNDWHLPSYAQSFLPRPAWMVAPKQCVIPDAWRSVEDERQWRRFHAAPATLLWW